MKTEPKPTRILRLVFSGQVMTFPVTPEAEAELQPMLDEAMAAAIGWGKYEGKPGIGALSVGPFRFNTRFWIGWSFEDQAPEHSCEVTENQKQAMRLMKIQTDILQKMDGKEDWQRGGDDEE